MVQGGMSCVKYLMFIFNFVFVVCGIALIIVGAVVQQKGTPYTEFLDSKYVTAPTILIVVGCLIFLLAFLGCCGAVKENSCMVTSFGVLLFIIIVIEIAGGITAYMYRSEFENLLKNNMNSTLIQQRKDGVILWDETQKDLKCCGVTGPKNYEYVTKANTTYPDLPKTCCKQELDTCNTDISYQIGCFKELKTKFQGLIGLVGGIAIGIGVVELLGCIFAWCLASAIRKEYEGV